MHAWEDGESDDGNDTRACNNAHFAEHVLQLIDPLIIVKSVGSWFDDNSKQSVRGKLEEGTAHRV